MSINSAGINSFTLDSIYSNRSALLNTLFGNAIVVSSLSFPDSVAPGDMVAGTVIFTNDGPGIANGAEFTLILSQGLSPSFSSLPSGASASYDSLTGVVTFTGMPVLLTAGTSFDIGVSYIQPTNGSSVSASFTTSSLNSDPAVGYSSTYISTSGTGPSPAFGGHHPQEIRDTEEVIELPYISVTIFLDGEQYVETLERGDEYFVPMVNVYDLKFTPIEIIHIFDIQLRVLEEVVSIFDIKLHVMEEVINIFDIVLKVL